MIRLSAFADEAGSSLEAQIAALQRNDIPYVEIRFVGPKNVSDLTLEEAADCAKQLAEAGITVWSIGSPIGKINITDDIDAHCEKLRHVCRLAKVFGTDKIRMFSFYEAYEAEDAVIAALEKMVAIAEEEGVLLCHENEKAIFGDTLERIERIMARVKGLRYVYDPANFLEVGEDAAKTLPALHGKVEYFHIKDVIAETHEIVPAGYGDGQIDRLVAMIDPREDKVLTLEPHLTAFSGYADIDSTEMKNKFHFKNNDESFDAAVAALTKIILDAGYTKVKGGFVKQ